MFKHVKAEFPGTDLAPLNVYEASLYQNRYEHEVASVTFWEWNVDYNVVEAGTPIKLTYSFVNDTKEFYGYVHHIDVTRTPGTHVTTVVAVGASFKMKQASQKIYKDLTPDAIIRQIASAHGFSCSAIPHPRVYPQVSQAGRTDWELVVRLAKQSGYSVRTTNTELYFEPMLYDFKKYKEQAPMFVLTPSTNGASLSTIYEFKPIVGESIEFEDAFKSVVAVGGVDNTSKSYINTVKPISNNKTRVNSKIEFFDKYATSTVARTLEMSQQEADAAEERNSFPYRGQAEVVGSPQLRPHYPVYLEGVGAKYDGYWTILGVEHRVITQENRTHVYTCILQLGTDSLGATNTAFDNSGVTQPANPQTRVIIPNVRQTNNPPSTSLYQPVPSLSPQIVGSFGNMQNRTTASTGVVAPVWTAGTTSLNSIAPVIGSTNTTSRTLAKALGIL